MTNKKKNDLNIEEMTNSSNHFVEEREWNVHHTVKNLLMGLSVETAELMELFQWKTDEEAASMKDDAEKKEEIADELGDILHYLIRFADAMEIDLKDAFWNKFEKTKAKYPTHLSKGKTCKYTELEQ